MAGKRAVRLRTPADVSRFLAAVINKTLRDEIDPQTAGKLGYLSNILLGALETSDLERRVEELEKITQQDTGRHVIAAGQ